MKVFKIAVLSIFLFLASQALFAMDKVDINSASISELASGLTGVGNVLAERIVLSREQDGPFHSADDLTRVHGVGPSVVENNRDRITTGSDVAQRD